MNDEGRPRPMIHFSCFYAVDGVITNSGESFIYIDNTFIQKHGSYKTLLTVLNLVKLVFHNYYENKSSGKVD